MKKGREGGREGERERRKEGGREGGKGRQLTACLSVAISYKTQPRAQISLKIRKYVQIKYIHSTIAMYCTSRNNNNYTNQYLLS